MSDIAALEVRRSRRRGLSARDRTLLVMQLGGYSRQQMAERVGLSEAAVAKDLERPAVCAERQRLLDGVPLDFMHLAPAVYEAVREALLPEMPIGTRLAAAKLWMETVGWMAHGEGGGVERVTAEDVAKELVAMVEARRGLMIEGGG